MEEREKRARLLMYIRETRASAGVFHFLGGSASREEEKKRRETGNTQSISDAIDP